MCMFAAWKDRGEQDGRKGEVYFFPECFITFCFPLIQASLESANSAGQMEMKAERLTVLWLPSACGAFSCAHKLPSRTAGGISGQHFAKAAGVRHLFGEITWWVISFRKFYSLFHADWVGNVGREMKEEE